MTLISHTRAKIQDSVLLRMLFLGALILVLQVPIAMITQAIHDRENTRAAALREVTGKWGGSQMLTGPIVVVPYISRWRDEKKVEQFKQHYAYFQPDTLLVDGEITTERRYRGIFEVPLYLGKVAVSGEIKRPDMRVWGIADRDVQWNSAVLVLGVSEPRSLREQVVLAWNDRSLSFEPGTSATSFLPAGIHAPGIFAESATDEVYKFSFALVVGGSDDLHFVPVGRDTRVSLGSLWPDPSFVGAYLPTTRDIGPEGFKATWQIPHLGRNYPQSWRDDEVKREALLSAAFGVSFISPVDAYTATLRAVKYQILFVFLTFLVFYLIELFQRLRIHPVQYLLVGAAMCLFYLLLLALSEHIGFDMAYGLAALPVVGMVGGYCAVILRRRRLGLYVAGKLILLYGFLYTLLQVEDYALLVGSLGLLLVLAGVMYVTRRIDWYRVGTQQTADPTS